MEIFWEYDEIGSMAILCNMIGYDAALVGIYCNGCFATSLDQLDSLSLVILPSTLPKSTTKLWVNPLNGSYPLVIKHSCGKSPFLMGKLTINGNFP